MNLSNYTTAQLIAAFNAHTSRDIKKFESRQIAEARVGALIRGGGLNIDAVLAELEPKPAAVAEPAEPASIDPGAELTEAQVPAFLRRSSPLPAIEAVAPVEQTATEIEYDAKVEEFFAMCGPDGRAGIHAAIAYGKTLGQAKAPRAKSERKPREPRAGGPTKREQAAALLTRAEGATTKEILDLTGWPAVSVPQLARSSKLTLRQEKDGKVTRYYGAAA